jgi:hypothetical protein
VILAGLLIGVAALRPWEWGRTSPDGTPRPEGNKEPAGPVLTRYEDVANCVFLPAPTDPLTAPELRIINVPKFQGMYAIWGATGRDTRGHIWIGVCANGVRLPSAHLFEFDPKNGNITDRGDVLSELRRAGLARDREGQMKIHSKIIQADDGRLYFVSMDEEGEKPDGTRLPTWGSHVWRVDPSDNHWEHLFAAPEGLIAVAAAPGKVYAMGYFDHVLYQYDWRTGTKRSVHVGAAGGHISRNFFADHRGHVYVPRLKKTPDGFRTTLVEYDGELTEVGETPIGHYTQTADDESHGIVAVQPLADRSVVFATDRGYLYHVTPRENGPAGVAELGPFHPKGEAYVGSMFTDDGKRHLWGMSRRHFNGDERYEWLVYDLEARTSTAVPVSLPVVDGRPLERLLLYGSFTRDDAGTCYLVGTYFRDGQERPVFMQARVSSR